MMEDDIDTGQVKELQGGKYMAVLFLKSGNTAAGLSGFLRDNGSSAYVYENEWEVRVLFCKLTDRSAGRIRKRMDECQLTGCVSELFSERTFVMERIRTVFCNKEGRKKHSLYRTDL